MTRTRLTTRSITLTIAAPAALAGALLLLALGCLGCKQPAPAIVDAGGPAPAPVTVDAAPAVLVPMDDDAGIDAGAVVVHHGGGGASNTNQIRAKQCCAALKAQAGTDPSLAAIVGMCNAVAAQLGPSTGGQAPEFAAVRNMLKGHNMPAICQGL
jgi:hypothetical protein